MKYFLRFFDAVKWKAIEKALNAIALSAVVSSCGNLSKKLTNFSSKDRDGLSCEENDVGTVYGTIVSTNWWVMKMTNAALSLCYIANC